MTFEMDGLRKNPNDEEAWLIYADKLNSRRDPRGELIALEHCLTHPDYVQGTVHNNLIDVRQKLRKVVEKQLKEKGVSHVLDWYHGIPRGVNFVGTSKQKYQLINKNPFIQPIETIVGDYRSFSKLVPGTRRHVDELWKDRLVVPELRDQWCYTAESAIYFLSKDGKSHDPTGRPYFALTRENQNLLLKDLDEAFDQILQTHNYHVPVGDLESTLADPATIVFDLDKLDLSRSWADYSTMEIPTVPRRRHPNDDQRRLIERVYGKDDDLEKVMSMMAEVGWSNTRVCVLNPSYVREHASAGAIGRASWFGIDNFNADDCDIRYLSCLRGVVQSERSES